MDFDFDDIAERADNLRSARKVEPQPQPNIHQVAFHGAADIGVF